jgi:hypothetical protein
MQEPVYSHSGDDNSCPIQPQAIICIQNDQTFLQWVILATEVFLFQGISPADKPHVLSRNVHIYRLMLQAIKDPNICYSDNTLYVLGAAGVGGVLLGNLSQGRNHLVALKLLIRKRGGSSVLQDMAFEKALPVILSYVFTETGEATFLNTRRLQEAIISLTSTFQAMQS